MTLKEIDKTIETLEKLGLPIDPKLIAERDALRAKPTSETPIYDTMIERAKFKITQEKKDCIEETVEELMKEGPDATQPGLLLGKIQCGKTDTFENIIGLAFDRGVDVAIVLTKGTLALLQQTVERMRTDYRWFKETDDIDQSQVIRIYDIHAISRGIKEAQVNGCKTIIACMKQAANLKNLIKIFNDYSPFLKDKKVLVIDDEADFASRNYKNVKLATQYDDEGNIVTQKKESTLAKISKQIEGLCSLPRWCRYLQVTATPYALFLQPNSELFLEGDKIRSFKPRFTKLVPVHSAYVGGDIYFEESKDEESMYSHLFCPVDQKSIDVMGHEDKRYLKSGVASANLASLTYALITYLMATAIRRIQKRKAQNKIYKSCAVFHVEIDKKSHDWQKRLVDRLLEDIESAIVDEEQTDQRIFQLIDRAYADFCESNRKGNVQGKISVDMPSVEEVQEEMANMFTTKNVHVQVVNSDEDVQHMLNDDGELSLDTAATIFIGGNVLDRGITIKNMLCFFYGRDPKQQDTVLQHARFYGARDAEDMAVSRLHTSQEIYKILAKMNELDNQLRQWFIDGNDKEGSEAIFVGYNKKFSPCAPSKVKISQSQLIRGGKRFLPVGFWTGTRKEISATVEEISKKIAACHGFANPDADGFFEMNLDEARKILELIQSTYRFDHDKHHNMDHKNDMRELIAALHYCVKKSDGRILGFLRTDRNINRLRENGKYQDSPDGRDTAIIRPKAVDVPVLSLYLQNGKKDVAEDHVNLGWNGTPFYWPVLMAQENIAPVTFAIDQKDENEVAVYDPNELLEGIDRQDVLFLTYKGNLIEHFGEEGTEYEEGKEEIETRDIKETVAGRYLFKQDGKWELNPDTVGDPESIDNVYAYNDGRFPFVLKPYKYILFRQGRNSQSNLMLVELTDPSQWDIDIHYQIEDGDLISRDGKPLIRVADTLTNRQMVTRDVENDQVCQWIILYKVKRVLKFKGRAIVSDDWTFADDEEDED